MVQKGGNFLLCFGASLGEHDLGTKVQATCPELARPLCTGRTLPLSYFSLCAVWHPPSLPWAQGRSKGGGLGADERSWCAWTVLAPLVGPPQHGAVKGREAGTGWQNIKGERMVGHSWFLYQAQPHCAA